MILVGDRVRRGEVRKADYLLRYTDGFPIAVVEAKSDKESAEAGLDELPLPEGVRKFSKGSPIQDQHFDEVKTIWKNPPPIEIVARLMEKEREILSIIEELFEMLNNSNPRGVNDGSKVD